MTWNYRVFHRFSPQWDTDEWTVRTTYYDDDGEIDGFSNSPVALGYESEEELVNELSEIVRAFTDPTIELTEDGTKIAGIRRGTLS